MGQVTHHRVCPVCGKAFVSHSNRGIYCSTACRVWVARAKRQGDRERARPQSKPCATCGSPIKNLKARYCSDQCRPKRVRDGKTYDRPTDKTKVCPACHAQFTTRRVQVYCSHFCASRYLTASRFAERIGRTCEYCGDSLPVSHRLGRRFCTESCQVKHNQMIRRARKRGLPAEQVVRSDVFDRDGWVCQLCYEPIDPQLKGRHPFSASIDHIVPLAYDWSPGHVMSNVQAAHLRCNISKRDRLTLIRG